MLKKECRCITFGKKPLLFIAILLTLSTKKNFHEKTTAFNDARGRCTYRLQQCTRKGS